MIQSEANVYIPSGVFFQVEQDKMTGSLSLLSSLLPSFVSCPFSFSFSFSFYSSLLFFFLSSAIFPNLCFYDKEIFRRYCFVFVLLLFFCWVSHIFSLCIKTAPTSQQPPLSPRRSPKKKRNESPKKSRNESPKKSRNESPKKSRNESPFKRRYGGKELIDSSSFSSSPALPTFSSWSSSTKPTTPPLSREGREAREREGEKEKELGKEEEEMIYQFFGNFLEGEQVCYYYYCCSMNLN